MTDPTSSSLEINKLLAIGATSVLVIGGLVYYFTSSNKSESSNSINQEELDELSKDSND